VRSGETAHSSQASTAAIARPDGLPDDFWDNEKGFRADALKAALDERNALKTEAEKRAAAIPEDPKAYKAELPDDVLKALPKDWEIKAEDPMWDKFREIAKATGLTQDQFKNLAGLKVKMDLAAAEENKAAIARHQESIHKALGDRGAERVEAVRTWLKSFNVAPQGDKPGSTVGEQLTHTIFTPEIAQWFEGVQKLMTSQGVTNFSQIGRSEGRTDGKPAGFENWSPINRRAWELENNAAAQRNH
jgi:hypothetical protein